MKSELGLVGTQTAPLRLQGRINTMKHLLTGVAVVAALAPGAGAYSQRAGALYLSLVRNTRDALTRA